MKLLKQMGFLIPSSVHVRLKMIKVIVFVRVGLVVEKKK
jgi:hypothetical protein